MGFFDDFTRTVKNSGIPLYSQAAGMVSGVTGLGADPDAPPPPEYVPFDYDQEAFKIDGQGQASRQLADQNQMNIHFQNAPGQANAGLYGEMLGAQRNAALGQGPSVAEMQMQQAQRQNGQAIQSAAGSTRGAGNLALAQMNAANQMAAGNQQAGYQGAMLRAQEMDQARKGMFGAIDQGNQSDIAGYNAKQQALAASQKTQQGWQDRRMQGAQALTNANAAQAAAKQNRVIGQYDNNQAAAAAAARGEQESQDKQMGVAGNLVGQAMAKK
jgi:hypothetical protein